VADPTTVNRSLVTPDYNQRGWDQTLNYNFGQLEGDPAAAGCITIPLAERPPAENGVPASTSLHVRVAPVTFLDSAGVPVAFPGEPALLLPASASSYLYLDDVGTLVQSLAGWPSSWHWRLGVVQTGTATVAVIDNSPKVFARTFGPPAWAVAPTRTAAYTALATDTLVPADATAGAFSVTLPDATAYVGAGITVKKLDVSANAVTVAGAGGQTIDGAATYPLTARWRAATVRSDGSNWLLTALV
jgi:hypothetical protein